MLVLTRKTEQKIRIGKNITITVLRVQGDSVSIGIDAPEELKIIRNELILDDLEDNVVRANRKSAIIRKNKNKNS
ncbi:MAG: hypothetical protein K940chlam2_01800 [Chlamydiae bacterium]|nr:hypothetical protein [Chlamydiota bacterium]